MRFQFSAVTLAVVAVCSGLVSGHGGTMVEAAQATPPKPTPQACTVDQERRWEQAAASQLGLAAGDSLEEHRWIGPFANQKKAAFLSPGAMGGRNWFPADVYKKTSCGGFTGLSIYDPRWSGAETDFHIHFQPKGMFEFSTRDLSAISGRSDIYGEITLPSAFRTNKPWFYPGARNDFASSDAKSDVLKPGDQVCMYGPWVTEEFHESQPELHPSELFWFRDGDALQVFAAHDTSNRFGARENYCPIDGPSRDCSTRVPRGFRPWSSPSSSYTLMVPYELSLDVPKRRDVGIVVKSSSRGNPSPGRQSDPTRFQTPAGLSELWFTKYSEANLISVVDAGEDQRCTSSANNGRRVLGFIEITLIVENDGAKAGYAHVAITGQPTDQQYLPVPVTKSAPVPAFDLSTLRWDGTGLTARVEGQGNAARPVFLREFAANGAVGLQARFKPIDDENRIARMLEVDLEGSYEPLDGEESLAEYLTAVWHGVSFEGPAGSTPLSRYARLFQTGRQFQTSVQIEFAGRTLAAERCRGTLRPPADGIAACVNDVRTALAPGGEVVDVRIAYGTRAVGDATLRATLTDPFGNTADVPARTLRFPVGAIPATGDSLPEPEVDAMIRGAQLSAEALASVQQARTDTGGALSKNREAGRLLSLPACDERDRRARLFWLMARAFHRDGPWDSREQSVLRGLLAAVKTAQVCQ